MADRDEQNQQLDELARLWHEQPEDDNPFDAQEVLMDVKQQSQKFDRTIAWRDAREALAGVAVLAWAGWFTWSEEGGWLPWLGFVALGVCFAYPIVQMIRTRRRSAGVAQDQPLVDRLAAEVATVAAQADLLRNVRSGYIAPIAIGMTIWMATLVPGSPVALHGLAPALFSVIGFNAVLFCVVGWGVWKLNQYALRKDLEPRLSELRHLLERARAGEA